MRNGKVQIVTVDYSQQNRGAQYLVQSCCIQYKDNSNDIQPLTGKEVQGGE